MIPLMSWKLLLLAAVLFILSQGIGMYCDGKHEEWEDFRSNRVAYWHAISAAPSFLFASCMLSMWLGLKEVAPGQFGLTVLFAILAIILSIRILWGVLESWDFGEIQYWMRQAKETLHRWRQKLRSNSADMRWSCVLQGGTFVLYGMLFLSITSTAIKTLISLLQHAHASN